VENVPDGWIVIHFYLNHLEKREKGDKSGYALIYDSNSKTWKERSFEFDSMFNAYMTWQTNYNRLPNKRKIDSAPYLEKLCIAIGEAMPFLFELSNDERPVLFIPHDFLHRLPLHGAIKIDANGRPNEVFLQKHPSCYLPAWSIAREKGGNTTNGNYMVKNYDRHNFRTLIRKATWVNIPDSTNPSTPDNLDSILSISPKPQSLVILCHGKADIVNPFNSKLLLNGNIKNCLDILNAGLNLMGSRVFLGACETDFVPPLTDTIDEHLSISTAFLNRDAQAIVGTLWEVADGFVDFIFSEIIDEPNLYKKIQELQKEAVKNNRDATQLYNWLAFRVIKSNFY
jgi:hypothetical protein